MWNRMNKAGWWNMKTGHTKKIRDAFFNTGNLIIEITLTLYSGTTNNIVLRTEQHKIPNDILHCTLHQDYEGGSQSFKYLKEESRSAFP